MVGGNGNTAAPSSVDGKQSEAHGSYADLGYSIYGIQVVIKDIGPTGATGRATPYRMTSGRAVENWHDMIGDHTFADTMADRLVYLSHRYTLTGGSSRQLRPTEFPTAYTPSSASLPG